MLEWQIKEELCRVGREIHARQYVSANDGNFSYRLSDNVVLATPTMMSKGALQPSDFVKIDLDGKKIEGKRETTSEIRMHLGIYKERPEIRCVLHAHPPHATAFAVAQLPVPKCVLPEVEFNLGEIPIVAYATPGTLQVIEALKPFIQDFKVLLLANHGIVSYAATIQEAHWNIEVTDAYCRVLLLTRQLGAPTQLTAQNMAELFKMKERVGLKDRRIAQPELQACDVPSPAPRAMADAPCNVTPVKMPADAGGAGGASVSTSSAAPTAPSSAPSAASDPQPQWVSACKPAWSGNKSEEELVEQITRAVMQKLGNH